MNPPEHIIQFAIEASLNSPCRSKRGAAMFDGDNLISVGWNAKPRGFTCDGSERCKATCGKEARAEDEMKIYFRNVGRDKKSWTADIADLADNSLLRQIRANGALMSRDIQFVWNSEGTGGEIYAGVIRKVGEYWVEDGIRTKPRGFTCDGSERCKATCGKEAVHAEQLALLNARSFGCEMLHVKTVDGRLASSGSPSCLECSKLILAAGLSAMWLYHEEGWRRYTAHEFHRLTLQYPAQHSERPIAAS